MSEERDRPSPVSPDQQAEAGDSVGGHHEHAPGDDAFGDYVVELPIDGVLDLHTFAPRDVPDLVPTYLDECRQRGILEIRIIHGKGKGTLRRTVHAILSRRDDVASFCLAAAERGGWGATLVTLRPEVPR